ncbi:MAG: hypothetical protein DRN64_03080 [Thaumarchaeota archaeon]|nr:MAG: hypothetical protein DRN64_03080 [Nitrososphaerota archaeon]RLG65895.1 MAG: hypothetical protein DRO02_00875 [archaeon]RLG66198.1 MAG: hypothetical protein DRO21_00100 [archaeon]HDM24156.1 NADH-quinone oxidoreductase subunit H [Candidatus Bathyarchaeota archaeon]
MLDAIITILQVLIFPGVLFAIILALLYEWVERKFKARLQNRIGPLYTGWHGILQPFADIIKLWSKEDIVPAEADKTMFTIAPMLALASQLISFLIIPVVSVYALVHFEGDLALLAFLSTVYLIAAGIGGLSSNNRFSAIGAGRSIIQHVGYEIPLLFVYASAAFIAQSWSLSKIVEYQVKTGVPLIAFLGIGFGISIISLLAFIERIPFDIPEAETEIVAGWLTEFSGKKYAFFWLADDVQLLVGAGITAALFLGGPCGPVPGIPIVDEILYVIYFIIKTVIIVLILASIEASSARYKITQAVSGFWKYLTPLSILQLLIVFALRLYGVI